MNRKTRTKTALRAWLCVCIMMLTTGMLYAQSDDDVTTELVIDGFEATGLGDDGSIGISIGGLFEGSAAIDINADFFINPLVAIRASANTLVPFATSSGQSQVNIAVDVGLGAIWRSYVVNRIRFYGGLMLRAGIAPLTDQDILLIPEGFGGFEFYASPSTSIYAEFGGRSAIPIISVGGAGPKEVYDYADGFFFKVGTRFGI